MPNSKIKQQTFSFLKGGGEMGRLMRNKDWSESTVGTPDLWPQSLRTTLGIILNSKFPMFLWWGPELICFYNDAYRPSLGQNGKHPSILGMPAKEAWPEIWDIIKPLIDQVLSGGEATWMEDQLIPIFRNGKIEDVYWTFSYSPVNDESGHVSGVLVTCTETTENVLTRHKLEESKNQLEFAIEAARLGTWDYNPANNKFTSNNRLKEWFGLPYEAEIELQHAINAIAEKDRQKVIDAIEKALDYSSGGNYETEYTIIHPFTKKETIVRTKGQAWFNEDKIAYRFNGILEDVTDAVISRKKVVESEEKFRRMVLHSPVAKAILRGKEHIIEVANKTLLEKIWRKKEDAVLGKRILDVFPELKDQKNAEFLDRVFATGEAHTELEFPLNLHDENGPTKFYLDFQYAPMRELDGSIIGVMITANDVTAQVKARQTVEEKEQQLRSFVQEASFPIGIYIGKEMRIQLVNQAILDVWGKGNDVIGKTFYEVLPELSGTGIYEELDKVFTTGVPYKAYHQRINLLIHGELEQHYFNYSFTPLFDTTGKIYGVMNTAAEVTDLVVAKQKVEESEQKFRNLIAQSPIPMVVYKGSEHVIEIVNSAMLKRWNKSESTVLNKRFLEVFPEAKDQKYPSLLDEVFKTGVGYKEAEAASYIQDKDGRKTFYVDFEYSPILKADGEVSGIFAIVNDVTEKVEARMKIEESEQKFRLLADSMPQHIWTADIEGNLNYFNRSVFDYSGLTPENINENGWLQIVHPDDKEENLKVWMNAVTTGKDFLFEHRFRKHDGEYRWQLSRAIPQRDEQGNIQMWVGTSTDIDEMKKHEQLKDDFIKIASHELKTPVTTISGYVQLLRQINKNSSDQMLTSSLATIDKHVSKLTKLISDLLDVTKIETGIFHLSKEKFNVNELISELIGDIQSTNSLHKIVFNHGSETSLFADKDRVSQVLINLIINAIKYSPKANTVIVSTQLKAEEIIVSVQDFGIGIDAGDHEKVFERFYRVQGKNEKTFPGFGIGLFIVKEIISNHNGKIWVESEKGKGSVFYFSLPVNTK